MYLSPRWCGYICCWVVIVSLANGQSPTQALKENLAQIKEEICRVKTESKSLRAELKCVQAKIDARAEKYKSEIEPIREEISCTLKSLTAIAFNINQLVLEEERKKKTLVFLQNLRVKTEFSVKVVKEEVQLLANRRELGIEGECFKIKSSMSFDDLEPLRASRCAVVTNFSSIAESRCGISARSLVREKTNIITVAALITAAEAELFGALEEQKRLKDDLQARKLLLEKNEASLQEDVENMAKTLKSNQKSHRELMDIFVGLENSIRELDAAISKESTILKELSKSMSESHRLLRAEYKSGRDCYNSIPENMGSTMTQSLSMIRKHEIYQSKSASQCLPKCIAHL